MSVEICGAPAIAPLLQMTTLPIDPKKPLTTPIELTALSLAYDKVAARLNVFLAGPYIKKGLTDGEIAALEPAARLRLKILRYLEEQQQFAILGEHRGITSIANDLIEDRASAALAELAVIKKECHAVIIIPASAGSFCELGAWAQLDKIAGKMLILCDENHKKPDSYIAAGVVTIAEFNGSTVKWVDFDDFDSIRSIINGFLKRIRGRLLARDIIHG